MYHSNAVFNDYKALIGTRHARATITERHELSSILTILVYGYIITEQLLYWRRQSGTRQQNSAREERIECKDNRAFFFIPGKSDVDMMKQRFCYRNLLQEQLSPIMTIINS